jgi:hypothetical protein
MMLSNDGGAPAVLLILVGLWFGQRGGLTHMEAEPIAPNYSAASRFQLVGASVTIPRPVEGQVPILASAGVPGYRQHTRAPLGP